MMVELILGLRVQKRHGQTRQSLEERRRNEQRFMKHDLGGNVNKLFSCSAITVHSFRISFGNYELFSPVLLM